MQFFTYLVGQYQAYYGAGVPSTNTDGLYTIMEETINNQLLEEISGQIGVGIEPELMYLISKDANNRCEMKIKKDGTLELEKSAGSIGCYAGPHPTKSLSHPALVDKVLVDYMIKKAIDQGDEMLQEPFDRTLAKELLAETLNPLTNAQRLTYLQNILASTSTSYIFSSTEQDMSKPDIIQMYNRTFLVTDRDENGKYMQRATAQAITPAVASRRSKAKEIPVQHDALAKSVMAKHGFTEFEEGTEASVMKINGIDTNQKIRIFNGDISILTKEQAMDIIRYIDTEAYITLIETAYNNSWMNVVPTFDENVNPLSDDSILTLDNIQQFANTEDKSYPTVVKLLQEASEVVVA